LLFYCYFYFVVCVDLLLELRIEFRAQCWRCRWGHCCL